MSPKVSRKGRPPGASPYAGQDEQALERMYALVREGTPVTTAARTVVAEMKVPGSSPEERLRKKFTRSRAKIETKVASRDKPQEPQPARPATIWEQALQTTAVLKTPEGKALIRSVREQARWANENPDSLRAAIALGRSTRKP